MVVSNNVLCEMANNVKLNFYSFGCATVKSSWNGHVKNPQFSRLYYIESGKACVEHSGERVELVPEKWYLLPAGFSFDYSCDKEMKHIFFHITLAGADGIDLLSRFEKPVSKKDNTKPFSFFKMHLKSDSFTSSVAIKEKIYGIVLSLLNKHNINPEVAELSGCVQSALEFINNNINKKIDLSAIAEHTFVSRSTLTNKFKKELNITVLEYIQRQKMFLAGQMLKNTNLTVAQISEHLGYSEQFYFSRCFKQSFGMSPREYRKSKIN